MIDQDEGGRHPKSVTGIFKSCPVLHQGLVSLETIEGPTRFADTSTEARVQHLQRLGAIWGTRAYSDLPARELDPDPPKTRP